MIPLFGAGLPTAPDVLTVRSPLSGLAGRPSVETCAGSETLAQRVLGTL